VIADARLDARGLRAALDHAIGILLVQRFVRQEACLSGGCAEQVAVGIAGDADSVDIFIEEMIKVMVTGNVMLLAALLVQPNPSAAALHEIVTDLHFSDGAYARKTVGHDADQGPIAQSEEIRLRRRSALLDFFNDRYAIEKRASFIGCQNRRLALFHDVFWTAYLMGRIDVDDVPGNKPVEQHAERGQVLLDGRWREIVLQVFNESGHMERLDARKLVDVFLRAPGGKAARGIKVCSARVVVIDLRREEFQDALCGLRRGREERRRPEESLSERATQVRSSVTEDGVPTCDGRLSYPSTSKEKQ